VRSRSPGTTRSATTSGRSCSARRIDQRRPGAADADPVGRTGVPAPPGRRGPTSSIGSGRRTLGARDLRPGRPR
jgi:hypothetical protein